MIIKFLDNLLDEKSACSSILAEINVGNYLELIELAYDEQGKISGQRDKLKTTSGVRIRNRMTEDFRSKAILPPVVLGLVVDQNEFGDIKKIQDLEGLNNLISAYDRSKISIIDGMQRTTVYKDTKEETKDFVIRVEFWIAFKTESLTYRMLVLNTGQVPWNLRRQVEVVYAPLLKEIEERTYEFYSELNGKINLYAIDDNSRRAKPGDYHKNDIVELYIHYGLRKEKIDTANILAEDFSRLDMIEAMANKSFFNDFIHVFSLLCKLDFAISENLNSPLDNAGKVSNGRNLFDSKPARAGFMVAASQTINGRIGNQRSEGERSKELQIIIERINSLIVKISSIEKENQEEFYAFSTLNERIQSAPTNKIGDWQRSFYLEAFRIMMTVDIEQSLEICWRAF